MLMLAHLSDGVNGKLNFALQYTVDRLKDPFLTVNRMQRELRRIIAQEEQLDVDDAERVTRRIAEGPAITEWDVVPIDPALVNARRAARRRDLDTSQTMATAMIALLVRGLKGLLAGAAHDAVDRLADPFLAMNRMQRELRRIIALAERLEEDDFQRAARLVVEKAAQAKAVHDAEIRRAADAERQAAQDRKDAIRNAVRLAAEDARPDDDDADEAVPNDEDGDDAAGDDDDRYTVEDLLDDLFDDYDTFESYDGDSVEIVARMCARLGLKPEADPSVAVDDGDKPVDKQARTLELARAYLLEAGWPPTPAPITDGRGPPDG